MKRALVKFWYAMRYPTCFQKPTRPYYATMVAEPGKSRLVLTSETGVPHYDLILVETRFDTREGGSAHFEDHTRWLQRHRFDRTMFDRKDQI